ncbi:MAG: MFS transporter [Betaproteobacteria bacterium]|nr:MFS transporter [Betaproteobacteria bacterium]
MTQNLFARLAEKPQFAALRQRDFRMLWIATLLSSTARWADMVVLGWLTLELTDSPLMVGIVTGSKMAGYLAAPFMGVVADRMDRRHLLIIAALINLAVAALMLWLFAAGWLALWHVIALALVSSVTWAIDNPARQALVPDLVAKEHLTNAVALNAVAMEITVVVGPALGGLLIPLLGMSGAYALIAAIFLLDVVVLLKMQSVKQHQPQVRESPARSLVEGFKYVGGNQIVLWLLVIAFLLNLLAAPYRYAFLPLFARYILDTGPTGYGMLTAMAGVGALAAGLWVVSLGNVKGKGKLLVWSSLAWPAALLLFALSTWYSLSLAFIFVAGLMQAIAWTVIATLILGSTLPAMRGRVMGLRTGVVVALPFGNFLAGAAAERFGAPIAQGAYGIAAILMMIAIVWWVPHLRKLD